MRRDNSGGGPAGGHPLEYPQYLLPTYVYVCGGCLVWPADSDKLPRATNMSASRYVNAYCLLVQLFCHTPLLFPLVMYRYSPDVFQHKNTAVQFTFDCIGGCCLLKLLRCPTEEGHTKIHSYAPRMMGQSSQSFHPIK